MHKIVAQVFPNNEIRITKSQSKAVRRHSECDEVGEVPCEFLAPSDFEMWSEFKKTSPPLSLVSNSKPERHSAGYGSLPEKPTTFGLNAKRQLIRSGAALETVATPEECVFLTGTLPGSTPAAFEAIAAYSGYIVNNLKAWIAKYVSAKLDFYCWEYQKRGALHLHYCVHVASRPDRDYIVGGFRDWWINTLHSIGERASVDMFRKNNTKTWLSDPSKVRAVAEICRKSPARYLAKYLSKSATPSRGPARAFTPSRWWGTSRPLKALLNSLTSVVEIAEGGYHAIRSRWEDVKREWSTSEGVSHSYRHKFGMGETLICYPSTPKDKEFLCSNLEALSTIQKVSLMSQISTPSKELRLVRDRLIRWLEESLISLSPSHQGLRLSLEVYLNMMRTLTPSTSTQPLSVLLCWAARTSDIRSLCQYTPVWKEGEAVLQDALDALDRNLAVVARDGWS